MPLALDHHIQGARLLLWEITETEEQLQKLVSKEDIDSANKYSRLNRRLEHLAWRAALRTIFPDTNISYTIDGAPVLGCSDLHIGVSHTTGLAAIIFYDKQCSVDVEHTSRDTSATQPRFLSGEEKDILTLEGQSNGLTPLHIWCAKEAIYKLLKRPGTDFLRDMNLTAIDGNKAIINTPTGEKKVEFMVWHDYIIAVTIQQ